MIPTNAYVFQIKDVAGNVVAEAPLIVHDTAKALEIWDRVLNNVPVTVDLRMVLQAMADMDGSESAISNYFAFMVTDQEPVPA